MIGDDDEEKCDDYTVKEEFIEWFYFDIDKEGEEEYSEMKTRFDAIKKVKKESKETKVYSSASPSHSLYPSYPWDNKDTNSYSYTSYLNPNKGHLDDVKPKKVKDNSFLYYDDDYYNNGYLDYDKIHADKDTVEMLVKNLITGSITITNSSKIDIIEFAKALPALYSKRFGTTGEGIHNTKLWVESMVEYLIYFTPDAKLEELGYDDAAVAAIFANDMIDSISKLPKNSYTDLMINVLKTYIL